MSNCYTEAFPRNSENDSVTLLSLAPSQRRLLRGGWALCSCRETWLPQVPWYEIVHSTAANAVIPKLDRIFAAYGVPEVVKTDNGPSFNEHEFAQLADYLGFVFRKVTPLWPEANGEIERFMKSFGKVLRTTDKLEAINVSVSPQLSCHPSP